MKCIEDYLGDGVYVVYDGYSFTLDLRMQDPVAARVPKICLEPAVLVALIRFRDRVGRMKHPHRLTKHPHRLTEKRALAALVVAAMAEADAQSMSGYPNDKEHADELYEGVAWIRAFVYHQSRKRNWTKPPFGGTP